jgi:hypothetical protein
MMTGERAWQLAQIGITDGRRVLVYFDGVECGICFAENGQAGLCQVIVDPDDALAAIEHIHAGGPDPAIEGVLRWRDAAGDKRRN